MPTRSKVSGSYFCSSSTRLTSLAARSVRMTAMAFDHSQGSRGFWTPTTCPNYTIPGPQGSVTPHGFSNADGKQGTALLAQACRLELDQPHGLLAKVQSPHGFA